MRSIFADAFEQAEPGAKQVVPMASRKGVNLRTHLERIIAKDGPAGVNPRQDAAQKPARRGHGWPGGREEVAGVGFEDMSFPSENEGSASFERADCSSLSDAQINQLAIAVGLVASMDVADRDRPIVLKRVLEFVAQQRIGKGPVAAGE